MYTATLLQRLEIVAYSRTAAAAGAFCPDASIIGVHGRGQSMHRFVHHQTQFEPDALCHRQPMQPADRGSGR